MQARARGQKGLDPSSKLRRSLQKRIIYYNLTIFRDFIGPSSIWRRAIGPNASIYGPPAILFYRCSLDLSFLFSPRNLRGRLAERQQTLPHVRR